MTRGLPAPPPDPGGWTRLIDQAAIEAALDELRVPRDATRVEATEPGGVLDQGVLDQGVLDQPGGSRRRGHPCSARTTRGMVERRRSG